MNNLEKEDSLTAENESLKARFLALGLDFSSSAHSLTSIRDQLSTTSSSEMVSNRVVKQLIIELYGDTICFTYPSNKRKSQMVLSTSSSSKALVESLRVSPVEKVANNLAQELKEYSFQLQKSFCEPHDLELSLDLFVKDPPPRWTEFCSYMFKGKTAAQLKIDAVFQILHYILSDGKVPTPFHIMVAQAVHGLTRSKELVTALNHHGICVSYNTVKRIDVDLAERIITTAGDNRVPLPSVLEKTSPLNGALDNFDRNESTLAGTSSTHDTILVLFQNVPTTLEKPPKESEISTRPFGAQNRSIVKLRSKVGCQQLIRIGALKERGEILACYKVSQNPFNSTTTAEPSSSACYASIAKAKISSTMSTASSLTTKATKGVNADHFLWIVNRLFKRATSEGDYMSQVLQL